MRRWNTKPPTPDTAPCDGCGTWLEPASFRLCTRCCRLRCGECLAGGKCGICGQIEEAERLSLKPGIVATKHELRPAGGPVGTVDTRTGEVLNPQPPTHAQILHALHAYLNAARDFGLTIAPPPPSTPDHLLTDLGGALKGLLKILPRAQQCGIPTTDTLAPVGPAVRNYRAALERLIQAHDEEALSAPQEAPPSAQAAGL